MVSKNKKSKNDPEEITEEEKQILQQYYNEKQQQQQEEPPQQEIKDNGARDHNSFWRNIKGMLNMKVCGVNSQWVKDLVLNRAAEDFQPHIIEKLDKIIQPWYLGTDEFVPTKEYKKKTIVFNHRAGVYTGSEWFFETMDELFKTIC